MKFKLKPIDFTPLKSPQGGNRSIKIFSFNLEFDSFYYICFTSSGKS